MRNKGNIFFAFIVGLGAWLALWYGLAPASFWERCVGMALCLIFCCIAIAIAFVINDHIETEKRKRLKQEAYDAERKEAREEESINGRLN